MDSKFINYNESESIFQSDNKNFVLMAKAINWVPSSTNGYTRFVCKKVKAKFTIAHTFLSITYLYKILLGQRHECNGENGINQSIFQHSVTYFFIPYENKGIYFCKRLKLLCYIAVQKWKIVTFARRISFPDFQVAAIINTRTANLWAPWSDQKQTETLVPACPFRSVALKRRIFMPPESEEVRFVFFGLL